MSSLQFGPVSPPVVPQILYRDARKVGEGPALAGRDRPSGAPIGDSLDRACPSRLRYLLQPPYTGHGLVELVSGQHVEGDDTPCVDSSQQEGDVKSRDRVHNALMGRPWKQFQDELDRRGKNLKWLADQLGSPIQRVHNWTTRGVPKGAYPEVAAAFDESLDWVAGLAPTRRRPPGEWDDDTKAFAAEYQLLDMDDRKMLRKLYEAVSTTHRGITPPAERPYLGGISGFGDIEEEKQRGTK